MNIGITVLGGGSRGNSLVIHTGDSGILIDAGFSRKETLARLARAQLSPDIIKTILITHEHGDHIKGCRLLSQELRVPICVSHHTYDYLRGSKGEEWSQVKIFSAGANFEFGQFSIAPFSVQHDAVDPVGFVIGCDGRRIGIATDLGCINELAKLRLHDCDALVLEANYDLEMLRNAERSLSLKRRIMGRHGHLDNRDAVAALDELLTPRSKALFLTHISSECNAHNLVEKLAGNKLQELGRTDIILKVIEQDNPTATVWV
ncbi:MAG: MBL fold metallo-hydrolase, partial [Victivallales bacterium]|nr:MBL fold metallo-hydrolase [Victivallales bacterium]